MPYKPLNLESYNLDENILLKLYGHQDNYYKSLGYTIENTTSKEVVKEKKKKKDRKVSKLVFDFFFEPKF